MKKRLVLPAETVNILNQFGDIDTVVNKVLDLVENGYIPAFNLPVACSSNVPMRKITVHITNKWYMDCITQNISRSISLRRILQFFVDNELFSEYNWQIVRKQRDDFKIALSEGVTNLITAATRTTNQAIRDKLYNIIVQLHMMEEDDD